VVPRELTRRRARRARSGPVVSGMPGALRRDRPPGRMLGAGASGRGGAQCRRLELIVRLDRQRRCFLPSVD
jgi:hypothetical protein